MSSKEGPAPPTMPVLHRQSSEDREIFLIEYAADKSSAREEIALDEGWRILQEYGIDVVANILLRDLVDKKPFGNRGYAALFTIGFNMCCNANTPDQSEELYGRVNQALEQFLRSHVVEPLLDPALVGVGMLIKFSKAWRNQKIMTKWIQLLFQHLDRGFVVNHDTHTLTSCGMTKFLEIGFGDTCLRVRSGVLEMINRERGGDQIDRDQLATCIEVFIVMGLCRGPNSKRLASVDKMLKMPPELDVYVVDFEAPFLQSTEEYYDNVGTQWRESDSVPEYLSRVEHALAEEQHRVQWYLEPSTDPKLQLVCVRTLLSQPQMDLIGREASGMYALLTEEKDQDLMRMFRLFQLPGVERGVMPMTVVFEQWVLDRGEALLEARRAEIKRLASEKKKESLSDVSMIMGMLQLHSKCTTMVNSLFDNNIDFQKALKSACQKFMNTDAGKYSNVMLLVAYCDGVLKGREGTERIAEQVMEERLEAAMKLFVYLADKDIFAEQYRDYLAKRLLNKKTTSMEIEKHMISRMKHLQGSNFTGKIEGMIKDFQMTKENDEQFSTYLRESGHAEQLGCLTSESSVTVLTLGFWPGQPKHAPHLPPELKVFQEVFEGHFMEKHNNKKKISWQFTLGDAEVLGLFPRGSYRLSVGTLQAVALMVLSNISEPIGLADMCQRLGLEEEVAKRVLHSLCCNPKYKVIKKLSSGKPNIINADDRFFPNAAFTSKSKRFILPMASLENIDHNIKQKVDEDRNYLIDAALVRTMKARKQLGHHELVAEVAHQLQTFNADPKRIKARIASLIEREYLERLDKDGAWTKEYVYLA